MCSCHVGGRGFDPRRPRQFYFLLEGFQQTQRFVPQTFANVSPGVKSSGLFNQKPRVQWPLETSGERSLKLTRRLLPGGIQNFLPPKSPKRA
jgi:hypothetical protein